VNRRAPRALRFVKPAHGCSPRRRRRLRLISRKPRRRQCCNIGRSKEAPMFQRILVPVDGSPTSAKALAAALRLARDGGRVRVVHSLEDPIDLTGYEYSPDLLRHTRGQGERVLQEAMDVAVAAWVPVDSRLLESFGKALGEEVAQEARAFEADLIVVGTHGRRGIGRMLLGSGAEQIVRQAPVPVLVVRDAADAPPP
jgi:nucleotide-binding universal stress UspA family protein